MPSKESTPELKIETKSVKHVFTDPERNDLGGSLARSIAGLRGVEAEFDQVKASYKARTAESEARIDNLSTSLMNGFEMRNERCVVIFRPKDRQKDFYLESTFKNGESPAPALTEEMTVADFQAELVEAESKFERKEEIDLFQATANDRGVLVVGRLAGKWFTALRVQIGKLKLEERLDSEQKCFKARADAIKTAIARVKAWSKEHLKELAKGFEEPFNAVYEAHKERAE